MTVLEVIQRSTEFLTRKGVESPRLQVELLLGHVLKVPRLQLYLKHDQPLTDVQTDQLRELVRRRGLREPLQHILGSTSFCGLEFTVNRDVLIPRPETELLAERAWTWLKDRSSARVLDFGTGSGCLAVTIAQHSPSAEVHALDISAAALTVARANAARHGLTERVAFHLGDGFAALPAGLRFDLIVTNPPYIAAVEIDTLEPEVRDFDPRNALDGGTDGLDFYRRLAEEAPNWLTAGGCLMAEFGEGQAPAITKCLTGQMWVVETVEKDYTQRERFLVARRNAV